MRKKELRPGDVAKLVVFGILMISMCVGGITGFAEVLNHLFVALIALALLTALGWILWKSNLSAVRKCGIALTSSGCVGLVFWGISRPPTIWYKALGTVVSISQPVTVDWTYSWTDSYRAQNAKTASFEAIRETSGQANEAFPKNATLFVDPVNDNRTSLVMQVGWIKIPAVKTKQTVTPRGNYPTRYKVAAEYTYKSTTSVSTYTAKLTRNFESRDACALARKSSIPVFIDPNDPTACSFAPQAGWISVGGTLVEEAIRQETTSPKALVKYRFHTLSGSVSLIGNGAANLRVGQEMKIWINPLNPRELSWTERRTEGGRNYALLFGALILGVSGIACFIVPQEVMQNGQQPKQWADAFRPEPARDLRTCEEMDQTARRPATPTVSERLNAIDWYQFEKVAAQLLRLDGWSVEQRGGAKADGGADLVATKNGVKAVAQCKHWRTWKVRVGVMQTLQGTKTSAAFKADAAMLFCLGECTADARTFAAENAIEIYDANRILSLVEKAGVNRFPELLNPESKCCPKCDAPMVLRQGRTPFYGCSRYPRGCDGKIEIPQGRNATSS